MKIGPYTLTALDTGRFALDGGAMFGVVPKNLWSRQIAADEQNRIPLALRCLLLRSDKYNILIDTGIGEKFDAKWQDIYNVDSSCPSLAEHLSHYGVAPEEITDVILSHLHFDHCGGTTFISGDSLRLRFPNARHHIQKKQWEWAFNPSGKDRASFMLENFNLLAQNNRVRLVDGNHEILPGIFSVELNGHTPGMQGVRITHQKKTLFYCADLIPTSAHLPLPWIMA